MRFTLFLAVAFVAATLLFGSVGCHLMSDSTVAAVDAKVCSCDAGKAGETTWCEACGKGFVGKVATKCQGCYQAKTGGEACGACSKSKK